MQVGPAFPDRGGLGEVGASASPGSQGDIWDAQWDMFLALVGAAISLATLGRLHLASMERLLGRKVE